MKKIKNFFKRSNFSPYRLIELKLFESERRTSRRLSQRLEALPKTFQWEEDGEQLIRSNRSYFTEEEKKIFHSFFIKKIPDALRRDYWLNASGARNEMKNHPNLYYDLIHNYPDYIPSNYDKVIIPDLKRTFPYEEAFQKEETLEQMHRILLAYSRRNSTVGYCQGFNYIIGRLMQVIKNEEETFWVFAQVIEKILPVEHYLELSGVMCDCAVLITFIKEYVPEVYNHLFSLKLDICLNNLLYKWLMSLFIQGMHKSIWLPVWDLLFLEGDIVLFRAAIIILSLSKEDILKKSDILEITKYFEEDISEFKNEKFLELLNTKKFNFNEAMITKMRSEYLPKVFENIKQSTGFKQKVNDDLECNLDWPVCVKEYSSFNIPRTMVFKTNEKVNIVKDFFNIEDNVPYFIKEKNSKYQNNIKNLYANEDSDSQFALYNKMLIDRCVHKCNEAKRESEIKNNRKPVKMFDSFFMMRRESKSNINPSQIIEDVEKSLVFEAISNLEKEIDMEEDVKEKKEGENVSSDDLDKFYLGNNSQ